MPDSAAERAELIENWYASETKEKIRSLPHRFFEVAGYHRRPVNRRIEYAHFTSPNRRVTLNRRRSEVTCVRPEPVRRELASGVVLAIQRLIELLELPPGWNSYNARSIKKENVNLAVALLGRIMTADTPVPHIIPKVRGGVQLEWHMRGINLEISIDSPEELSFFAEDLHDAEPEETTARELDEKVLTQWIDRLSV